MTPLRVSRVLVPGAAEGEVLALTEPLSFWGGLDPETGIVTDARHPQRGAVLTGRVLVMPSGRGSSSSASVLAEAIRAGTGPAAIVLAEADPIVVIGALVAGELYDIHVPVVEVADAGDYEATVAAARLRVSDGVIAPTSAIVSDGDGSSFMIRVAGVGDVARLDTAYPEPDRPTSRHSEHAGLQWNGEGVYLIAWHDDDPIGWVFLRRPGARDSSERAVALGAAELVDLWIAPRSRGRGHGAALLDAAEALAREAGWRTLGLSVTVANPNNEIARGMYERHGYVDAGLGEFEDGYAYWTVSGEERWDGEPHRFLIKSLPA